MPPSPYALDRARGSDDPLAALKGKRVFFDGVFLGDYSLAIVNRQLARALLAAGIDVSIYSDEEGLDSDPHLAAMPDVAAQRLAAPPARDSVDIHLRNTWPPRADDMIGRLNAYVCFAWEESVVPSAMVKHFNAHLDLMLVTASFVEEAFRRSGLTVPMAVIGNGVDHLTQSSDETPEAGDTRAGQGTTPDGLGEIAKRRILHVSSCFPRKGADILARSFARGFTAADNVELVIKTFDNPHNTIARDVAAARKAHPDAAPIRVIKASLSDTALRAMIREADVLAAPSRGEGFGLPLAEAMMLGVPVVTTGYSGQTDFCSEETAFLIDYTLVASDAHVTAGGIAGSRSLWAEPDGDALAAALRRALEDRAEAQRRTAAGRRLLAEHFTWRRVAERLGLALASLGMRRPAECARAPAAIDLVSSWNQTCGIATYAAHLFATDALAPRLAHVHARLLDDDAAMIALRDDLPVTRSWGYTGAALDRLAADIASGAAQGTTDSPTPCEGVHHSAGSGDGGRTRVLWFQHHPGHFSDGDMARLVPAIAASPHATRLITLHNVRETLQKPAKWLAAFDAVIVHTEADRALIEKRNHAAAVVIPHGILPPPEARPPDPAHVTVGTFGFLYPHKNIPLLVEALARARMHAPMLRLRLLTCARGDRVSRRERARVEATIAALGVEDAVETDFRFLDEDRVRNRLAGCDILCFPYGPSSESATGAARIALSLNRPILCSDSAVLRDIHPIAMGLPSLTVEALAEALIVLAASPAIRALRERARRATVEAHGYDRIGARHARLIDRLDGGLAHAA
ncbi:MAG: glycosyltransferase [Pseudomonadota bacterium]